MIENINDTDSVKMNKLPKSFLRAYAKFVEQELYLLQGSPTNGR